MESGYNFFVFSSNELHLPIFPKTPAHRLLKDVAHNADGNGMGTLVQIYPGGGGSEEEKTTTRFQTMSQ